MVVNASQDGSNQLRGFEGAREKVIQLLVPFTSSLLCFACVVATVSLISNVCLPFSWLLLRSCILNKAHPDLKLSLSGLPPISPRPRLPEVLLPPRLLHLPGALTLLSFPSEHLCVRMPPWM